MIDLKTHRIFLAVFYCLLWTVGLVFLVLGVFTYTALLEFFEEESDETSWVEAMPIGFIVFGVFVIVISLVACVTLTRSEPNIIFLLAIVFALIFLVQVFLTAGGFLYKKDLDKKLVDRLNSSVQLYRSGDSRRDAQLNSIQAGIKCCGIVDYTDWFDTAWSKGRHMVPPSCCINLNACHNLAPLVDDDVYKRGCYQAVKDAIEKGTIGIAVIMFIILVVQLSGIVLTLILGVRFQKRGENRRDSMQVSQIDEALEP